ncbi:HTH_48 domain-containing protein [Trichonephila clavipes]|nr:HTH_48 domain-containing protein [Trichonephila clavipes]
MVENWTTSIENLRSTDVEPKKFKTLVLDHYNIVAVKQVFLVCYEMSDNNFEQQCTIKFCFRLGHNATETFATLQQAHGDSALSRAFRWFKAFSEARQSIEEPRSGRPSVSKPLKMWLESGILHVQIVT